jgi:uncharacterized protein (DUF58 family)
MIVPQNRLLFWFALIVPPFAALGSAHSAAFWTGLAVVGVFLLLLAADAFLSRNGLRGIDVDLPVVVRTSKDREAMLEMHIRNASQQARSIRVALGLPLELASAREEIPVMLPAGSEWSRMPWPCQPLKRGSFRLDSVFLECASPLGFWGIRARRSVSCEIRVYPNLLMERRQLASMFLNRGSLGLHSRRQVGKGREFEKLREYVPGDSYDEIHWKATARRGRPVTKVFQIERTQEVYVIIDSSRLMAREPMAESGPSVTSIETGQSTIRPAASVAQPATTLERFITAGLVLGLAAEQHGDLFGMLTFSERMGVFLRARNGKAHYGACRDALYTLEPRQVNPDFDEVCAFIRTRLRRRALLVFLTALDDPLLAEGFVRNMDLLCRQHLVLVNMMRPPGAEPLFSDPGPDSLDDVYRQFGGHERWHRLQELGRALQRRGVGFSVLDNERLSSRIVAQYVNVKKRQML